MEKSPYFIGKSTVNRPLSIATYMLIYQRVCIYIYMIIYVCICIYILYIVQICIYTYIHTVHIIGSYDSPPRSVPPQQFSKWTLCSYSNIGRGGRSRKEIITQCQIPTLKIMCGLWDLSFKTQVFLFYHGMEVSNSRFSNSYVYVYICVYTCMYI